jgi:amino acid transporter
VALCYALPGGVDSKSYGAIAGLGVAASAGVFLDAMNRHVAECLILVGIGGMLFCGMASLTSNSRMIYAFSRDGAVPGHRLWHKINPRTRTPTNSIWFAAVFAFIIGIPSLKSSVAFAAIVAVAVSSQTIAFVLPVFLRRRRGSDFVPGPFSLGRWSAVVNWIALIWTAVITVTLLLPESTLHADGKFKWSLFNFAPVACAVVMGYAAISWLVWARKWFTGPKVQGASEVAAPQETPEVVTI